MIDSQGFSSGIDLAWNKTKIQMETYWSTKWTITKKFTYIRTIVT